MPKAFISYSWDSEDHKKWVRDLAVRLRRDGVDVVLDQWHAIPGDQLPAFMERAVRENDFVLIICTPRYKGKADARTGGVGYEGDIMTAEAMTKRNDRKFIPILRGEEWAQASPSWLAGKYYIDLHGEPYSEGHYTDLLTTLHSQREQAPPIGLPPFQPQLGQYSFLSPDMRYEATRVGMGGEIHYQVKEVETGRVVLLTYPEYSPNDVKAGAFSPDSKKLAAAYHYSHLGHYTWIGIWDIGTRVLLRSEKKAGWVTDISWIFES